jgi:hypothetical protein
MRGNVGIDRGGQLENAADGLVILASNPIATAIGELGRIEFPAQGATIEGQGDLGFPCIEFVPPTRRTAPASINLPLEDLIFAVLWRS